MIHREFIFHRSWGTKELFCCIFSLFRLAHKISELPLYTVNEAQQYEWRVKEKRENENEDTDSAVITKPPEVLVTSKAFYQRRKTCLVTFGEGYSQ